MNKNYNNKAEVTYVSRPRFFFLEYYLFSIFTTFEKDDSGTGTYKTIILLLFLITATISCMLCLFSEYIYDINNVIIELWPFKSDVYKSPLNPKTAPASIAILMALLLYWKYWSKDIILQIVKEFQLQRYKSQGWIFFVISFFMLAFIALFSRVNSLLATGMLILLFACIHIIGKHSIDKRAEKE